jgi:hypothetical protein
MRRLYIAAAGCLERDRGGEIGQRAEKGDGEVRRHTYVRAAQLTFAMDPGRIGGDRAPRALPDQLLLEESRAPPDQVLNVQSKSIERE